MNFLLKLTGSFARPCAENPTVAIIEAAYRHHRLPWRYINCEVAPESLGDAVRGARAMGWAGFNCSLPHKQAVIVHLDGLGRSAEIVRAVNCVVRRKDDYIGENTDGLGFVQAVERHTRLPGKSVVLFGAGGAARAIAVEAALCGAAKITIVNRNAERAANLARLLRECTPCETESRATQPAFRLPPETDLVVNATSLGLYPEIHAAPDVNWSTLLPTMIVADVIANPRRTRFTQLAEARGCVVVDGQQMLVNQATICVKHWTGVDIDPRIMHKSLRALFGEAPVADARSASLRNRHHGELAAELAAGNSNGGLDRHAPGGD